MYEWLQCKLWTLRDYDDEPRFTDYKKCTSLVEDADNGEAVHVWEQGLYKKSLYFLLNFAVNL